MAEKQQRAAIHVALKTFLIDGNQWVRAGDTVVAGHPVLKGREHMFGPFKPTFGSWTPTPEPAPEPEADAETGGAE